MTRNQIDAIRARLNAFLGLPENRHGGGVRVADACGVSKQWISSFAGGAKVGGNTAQKISDALDQLTGTIAVPVAAEAAPEYVAQATRSDRNTVIANKLRAVADLIESDNPMFTAQIKARALKDLADFILAVHRLVNASLNKKPKKRV